MTVHDAAGRLVQTLVDRRFEPGLHETRWDGRDEAGRAAESGVYFCRLAAGSFISTRKLVLLR